MTRLLVFVTLLLLPVAGVAQETPTAPTGGCPPQVVVAKVMSGGGNVKLVMTIPQTVYEEVVEKVQVEENGIIKEIERKTVRHRLVFTDRTHVVDGKKVAVLRKNGKEVAPGELPALLAKSTVAVWFCGKVDPYYTQVLRDDVLIIRTPEHQAEALPLEKEFPKQPPPKEKE
jgi:hypothetical protein